MRTGGQHTRVGQCLPRPLLAACPLAFSLTSPFSGVARAGAQHVSPRETKGEEKRKAGPLGAVSVKTRALRLCRSGLSWLLLEG